MCVIADKRQDSVTTVNFSFWECTNSNREEGEGASEPGEDVIFLLAEGRRFWGENRGWIFSLPLNVFVLFSLPLNYINSYP